MHIRTRVRFTSLRSAKGYDLVPIPKAGSSKITFGQIRLRTKLGLSIPSNWLTRLRPRGPEDVATEPLDYVVDLFKRFAELPYDPLAYKGFCDKWGLLSPVRFLDFSSFTRPAKGDQVVPFVTELLVLSIAGFHSIVRSALGLATRAEPACVRTFRNQQVKLPLGADRHAQSSLFDGRYFLPDPLVHLDALITYGIRGGTETDRESNIQTLVLRPANLMVAIALQTAHHLSGAEEREGVKLVQCLQCSEPFKVGPGTGHRASRKFCSNKCQDRHSYRTRKTRMEDRA